ncbi:hypothetical protein G6F65_016164 [Rhizopus arrhizus]|nr:hypothetical protein G6F65_016164 [Rhizopus arrhizus]
MFNPASYPDRHLSMEGIYEYGSRAGVWRILREFEKRQLPLTVFGVGMALQRHPELTAAFVELGHEIACHGWRWVHYQNVDEATEREHMRLGMDAITRLTGTRPLGWYTGRDSPRTRRLVADDGGFEYDSDYYGDDLPFWMQVQKTDGSVVPQLIVIATLEAASAILLEASLSFLGLGVQPPLPSWGLMISEAKAYMFFSFWLIAIPGSALALLIFAINLAGDGLHQLLTPEERA